MSLRANLVVAFAASVIFTFLAFNQWVPDLAWGTAMLWAIFISAIISFFGFQFLKRYPVSQGEGRAGMFFMATATVIAFIGFLIPQPPLLDWFTSKLGSDELAVGFGAGLLGGMAGTLYTFFAQG